MDWRELLRQGLQSGKEIGGFLGLSEEEMTQMDEITKRYPAFINAYYLSLIDPQDAQDPIRKMSVPSAWEFEQGGEEDTSGEGDNTVLPGMQHKYGQTALILSTSKCAMYCRHCFRKRMVGLSDDEIAVHLPEMREYILAHSEITNVLISGGDAFLNSNERIEAYLETFASLPQLDLIRFGTRTPVVLPQRITEDEKLQDILKRYAKKKQIYVVTQFNHPREITKEAAAAVRCLNEMGIVVKNQTVLLHEINDDPLVLAELLSKLTANGVVPYYIFQCRPVRGVLNHFQVPLQKGVQIVDEAKQLQNGQGKCVRYVMSHPSGKIEILGKNERGVMVFKYHQAKNGRDSHRLFEKEIGETQYWL